MSSIRATRVPVRPGVWASCLWAFAALAACAPPAPATAPAPEAARPEAVLACTTPLEATDDWWLLDAEEDCYPGISAARVARDVLAGRQPQRRVVIAIVDSGSDIGHEALRAHLWRNPGEGPGTGRDDDGNGYPDDVHGWNFIGGPDGRNVHHDTYEVARIYASLRHLAGARPDTLSPPQRARYEQYLEVRDELEHERQEAEEQLQQVIAIAGILPQVNALLEQHLGTDSLTRARVQLMQAPSPQLRQAREIWLELDSFGITMRVLEDAHEQLENKLTYGLDPDFDPRHIVGDDPADLRERFYGNPDVVGPDARHGTHVAGIVLAWRALLGDAVPFELMIIRAVPDGDERDKDVANAIRYAVENGAHIINMSFGKGHSPQREVVDEAIRLADERGVLMVHAAGNSAEDLRESPNYPTRRLLGGGEARHWIEVGASAWWGADSLAASFSNFGSGEVDLFAPGMAIHSAIPGGEFERNDGTSMAAPVVSGVAALLMAYYPELSAAQVRDILLESATRHPGLRVIVPGPERTRVPFTDLSTTGGVVNAYRAVRLAEERRAAAAAN
jgi:subtilisin family serine protease